MTYSIYATDGEWLVGNWTADSHEDALLRYAAKDAAERVAGGGRWARRLVRSGNVYIVAQETGYRETKHNQGQIRALRLTEAPPTMPTFTVKEV